MPNRNQDLLIPPADEIESVTEFTKKVKYLLETEIGGAWIRGEVSNLRRQASGHVYFSLKDEGSQVSSVLFRNDAYKQSVDLEDGMQVVVFGQISVYEPRGNYQLIVRLVVQDGLGKLQREFERLKAQLLEEGLFDEDIKKPIPTFPRAVGIITSPTGAAVQDFIRILKRREWVGHILVLPAKVQGEGSAEEIASMIDFAQKLSGLELLVVGRGGGSLEDLWAFNEEAVVRAIHRSDLPVISAVGHEIDFTLSDFASDMRAETPSAAAEVISSHYLELIDRFDTAADNLAYWTSDGLQTRKDSIEQLQRRLQLLSPVSRIEQSQLRVDDLSSRLASVLSSSFLEYRNRLSEAKLTIQTADPSSRIKRYRLQAQSDGHRLLAAMSSEFMEKRSRLYRAESLLRSLSPESILNRGFAIIRDDVGRPITSRKSIQSGDKVTAEFKDGEANLLGE
ncbi:exodeoxyribonuclease VII large subunit [Opitutia bacterium ISCC 51]|nr:exodeoxyribonuclease VII large subunit [Opitutae bacterium ISCC 51]QXD28372.1 exodeoxyribonuclease VII large subunit [Opitutae bacterium ISCC 52]